MHQTLVCFCFKVGHVVVWGLVLHFYLHFFAFEFIWYSVVINIFLYAGQTRMMHYVLGWNSSKVLKRFRGPSWWSGHQASCLMRGHLRSLSCSTGLIGQPVFRNIWDQLRSSVLRTMCCLRLNRVGHIQGLCLNPYRISKCSGVYNGIS